MDRPKITMSKGRCPPEAVMRPPPVGWGTGSGVPTTAAEHERLARKAPGRLEKEPPHACFAIGQPVAEKAQSTRKPGIRGYRMMRLGIEGVVDRNAIARAPGA